ncbi:hypothetical protein CD790_33025 [Streptomyces sp. SAJ15]|nr:hypothetical protein CD790_33025 [Streptomyces sp. SAJ15]
MVDPHWDDLLRLAGSLKYGHATTSLVVGKLSASSRQNALAAALKEYGAIRKTIYAAKCLSDPAYRRKIARQLNKGESLHSLRRQLHRPEPAGRPRADRRVRRHPGGHRRAHGHRLCVPEEVVAVTVMVPSARPTAPRPDRLVAAVALALSLAMSWWPLRWQIATVRLLRGLPYARLARVEALYAAVLAVSPAWWPGRIACMEISLATVIATALTGRQARWVLGARFLPDAAHAWVEVPEGAVGRDIGDAADRPWMPVLSVP